MNKRIEGVRSSIRLWFPSLICLFVFIPIATYALASWRSTAMQPFRELKLVGDWIRVAGQGSRAGYFRKRFDVTSEIRRAWIVMASNGGCEVSVNRNPMGRIYLWRPTRGFQSGMSEKGQVMNPQDPALALNFPREYQWSGHDNWKLPLYVDLTPSFQLGKNTVSIEVESRALPAMVSFHGAIEFWSGETIPIRSDASWLGEPHPPGPQLYDWTETNYWDKGWKNAIPCDGPATQVQRIVPESIYSRSFSGSWLKHPSANSTSAVSFRNVWHLDDEVDEAWLRLVTNRPFEIYVNDQRVSVRSINSSDPDTGEWIMGKAAAIDPISNPELLDPDEVGNFFIGDSFESPRKADQLLEEFVPALPMHNMPFQYKRTTNRSEAPGIYDPERTLAESRRTPRLPDYFPEKPVPHALKRDRSVGGVFAYSIGPLLSPGPNTIEVRCVGKSDANWSPQIAVDGGGTVVNGKALSPLSTINWQTKLLAPTEEWTSALSDGLVDSPAEKMPSVRYRGNAQPKVGFRDQMPRALRDIVLVCMACLSTYLLWSYSRRRGHVRSLRMVAESISSSLLVGSATLGTTLLLCASWRERDECIWFDTGSAWSISFGATLIAMFCVAGLVSNGRSPFPTIPFDLRDLLRALRDLPESRFWSHFLFWVLLLCTLLRAYKLDLQPLDDDEYASTQAILAILETGVPGFAAEGVFYTRSPLFHYITAAIAYPFGGNLWSLRLQSVAWSVATVWLTYLCGAKLLGSKWVGAIAMLLMTIHPLEIFTGHVIRFYQMQQFFALLCVYMFCIGFVTQQKQSYRIGTIVVFTAAVLSQEITAAMSLPMLFCFLLFSKDLGWRANVQLIAVAMMAGALIAVDFLAFQTLCLTRTEGVSPTVEASVKPHFWQPLNFISVLIGYSRLHVVLSAFLILGAPLLCRGRNRNTLAFLAFFVSGVIATNLLVTNSSLRYQYWLFPMWLLLSVESIRIVLVHSASFLFSSRTNSLPYLATTATSAVIIVLGCIASFSPWRIMNSYELSILGDSTGCVRYVHSQMRSDDRIAISEPHTHAAVIEHGRVDYDVSIPLLFDFAVMKHGRLVDRNGGALMVSNLDSLKHEFAKGGRVWVLINREKFRARGKNLRWEYPGARFEMFLRKNCELKYRTYLWSAYLWEPAHGYYSHFRTQE